MNQETKFEKTLSLGDLIFLVKKNILLIMLITFLTTSIFSVYDFFIKPITYTATTTIIIEVDLEEVNDNPGSAIQASQLLMNTYKDYIITQPVLTNTVLKLQDVFPEITKSEIKESINIAVSVSSLIIVISCSTNDYEKSIIIVNSLVESSIEIANDINENGDFMFKTLANRIKVMEEAYDSSASRVSILTIILGFTIGLILSFSFVIIVFYANSSFNSKKEFETLFNINILACLREAESEGY